MIIKPFNEHNANAAIQELESLLALPSLNQNTQNKITQEIKKIRSGLTGEKEAAYQLDFHWGQSKNWMVIHDLHIEYNGLSAQIDHLIINRFMEIYVCESKRFSEGIAINDHGEFSMFYNGKPYGIQSPIEQNNRHIALLEKIFSDNLIELPTRMGIPIKPKLFSLILVANSARIIRPNKKFKGLDRVIKNEQVKNIIQKDIDSNLNFLEIARLISPDTVAAFAQNLAKLHQPQSFDWQAKFGIDPAIKQSVDPVVENSADPQLNSHPTINLPSPDKEQSNQQHKRLFCAACKKTVSTNVAQFCWSHKNQFGGKVYCYSCQKNFLPPQ